jgi:nucleoside-diphosphate-sugar epimerase
MMNGIKKGWFPPLPETGNRRSMVHVDDVVRALLLLASDQQSNGETFIVTDGRTYSSRDIYKIMSSTLGKRIPRWTVPLFLFNVIALINPHLRYRIDKLLGDEYYSSNKIQSIGFKAKKTLKDMHETNF